MENWIKATYKGLDEEKEILVKQYEPCSATFVDKDGALYGIEDLDFTVKDDEAPELDILKQFEQTQKRFEEQNAIHNEMMERILDSMDANTIADHKAELDEQEYWRKLRGDIALEIIRKRCDSSYYGQPAHYKLIAEMTETLFNELYEQDKKFNENKDNSYE